MTDTPIDPRQVGREVYLRRKHEELNSFTPNFDRKVLDGECDDKCAPYIAGATEMLARLSAAPAPDGVWVSRDDLRRVAIGSHTRSKPKSDFVVFGSHCHFCGSSWVDGEPEYHGPNCPLAAPGGVNG